MIVKSLIAERERERERERETDIERLGMSERGREKVRKRGREKVRKRENEGEKYGDREKVFVCV